MGVEDAVYHDAAVGLPHLDAEPKPVRVAQQHIARLKRGQREDLETHGDELDVKISNGCIPAR